MLINCTCESKLMLIEDSIGVCNATHAFTTFMQVLSKSVADSLKYYGEKETAGTQEFCRIMDKFFDCLNVHCLQAWFENKKSNLKPYTKPNDPRLKVHYLIAYIGMLYM